MPFGASLAAILSRDSGAFAPPPFLLSPNRIIVGTKSGSNPTFNFSAIPESIIKDGSTYWCIYQGNWGGARDARLASASDINGPWTAYGSNPILTSGSQSWESAISNDGINAPEFYLSGGTYYLYYAVEDTSAGSYGAIGVATASTITGPYTKYASNPILVPGTGGAWDSRRVVEPSVLYDGSQWIMAYMGEDDDVTWGESERIGIATASDPLGPWTKVESNPLIDWGTGDDWDTKLAADPFIFEDNGYYWIWYSGGEGSVGEFSRPWSAGLAYSTSPTSSWTKHTSNPIITYGGAGAFDEKGAWRGSIFAEGGLYYAVFGGINAALNAVKGGNAAIDVT